MNAYTRISLATVLACVTIPLVGCDEPRIPSAASTAASSAATSTNAADTYRKVHASFGKSMLAALDSEKNVDAQLVAHAADIDALLTAAALPECDFQVDYSASLAMELPHVTSMRSLSRALKADATRLLATGDRDGAARRVAAMMRMGDQLGRSSRVIIEMLVASAIANSGAQFVIENPSLAQAAWKSDIQQAIAKLVQNEAFASGLVAQRDLMFTATSLRDGTALDLSSLGGRDWSTASTADREAAAREIESVANDLPAAWGARDSIARLKALTARSKNALAGELMPRLDSVRKGMDMFLAAVSKANETLSQ